MAIEHRDARVLGIQPSRIASGFVVTVRSNFLMYYDGEIIPGFRIERVFINTQQDELSKTEEHAAIKQARMKVEQYYDGGRPNGDNIFCEDLWARNRYGLTDSEELSLLHDLKSIELGTEELDLLHQELLLSTASPPVNGRQVDAKAACS